MDRYRKRRFAKNLDALLTARCVTRKEAAADAKVPYQWLRRAVTDGLSRPDKRSRGHLEALACYLDLPSVERLWDRALYVPSPPSSIQDEADRLAELMRQFVLAVGPNDVLLREIVIRIGPVVREHQERQRRVAEEEERRRRSEELDAGIAESIERRDGREAVDSWRERQEQARLEQEKLRREQEERAKSFREANERVCAIVDTLELFRREVVERWRTVGMPRVDEVEVPVAEVVALAERDGQKTTQELAPLVSDLWIGKYARVLGKEPALVKEFIREFVWRTFGLDSNGDRLGTPSGVGAGEFGMAIEERPWWRTSYLPAEPSSIKDEADEPVREMRRGVGAGYLGAASDGGQALGGGEESAEGGPELSCARRIIEELEQQWFQYWRANRLPRIDEVVVSPQEIAIHVLPLGLAPDHLAEHTLEVLWLPKYARLIGKSEDEAIDLVNSYSDGVSDKEDRPSRGDRTPEEAEPRTERSMGVVVSLARASARRLAEQVWAGLTVEQTEDFIQGYESRELAARYIEDDLANRTLGIKVECGVPLPKQAPDEAVRAVVAEIVEDYTKSLQEAEGGAPDDLDDEPIALDTKLLEARHGDVETPEEFDHGGVPLPVGTALEAEIARSVADDSADGGSIDDILLPLSDLPLPGGKGTYRDSIKHLGDERMVATTSLRACGGDPGKALQWLIEEVNKSIQAGESRAAPTRRSESARAAAPAKVSGRRKRSVKIRAKDIRESVLVSHRIGASADEIINELQDDESNPEWVRRASRAALKGVIGRIVDRYEAEKAEASARDEYDAGLEDDRRRWEMGYGDDPDAR